MTTGDAVLDAWLLVASWLFLAGVVAAGLSVVPAVARRSPRLLLYGFLTSVASLLLALAAALLRSAG